MKEPSITSEDDQAGLAFLHKRWTKVVEEIESGYRGSIDDYTNDLTVRDLLDELLPSGAQTESSDQLMREIEPLDRRFEAATSPGERQLLRRFFRGASNAWWWDRVPCNGHLAENLERYR